MSKKLVVVLLILIAVAAGGVWYYKTQIQSTRIEKILSSPREFEGKEITIEGEVSDRTSLFGVLKFFKLRDKTGEIIVLTRKALPQVKAVVSVKGRIDDAFPVGDQKLLVFVEESVAEKGMK